MVTMGAVAPSRWIYVPSALHLIICLIAYIGILIPALESWGIIFTALWIIDFPVSLLGFALAWKHSLLSALWIFIAGTLWWYLISRLPMRYSRDLTWSEERRRI